MGPLGGFHGQPESTKPALLLQIVVDTHSGSLVWTIYEGEDLAEDLTHRQLILLRTRAGGVTAQFLAAWVNPGKFGLESYIRRPWTSSMP